MPIIEDAGQYGWSFEPLNAQNSVAEREDYSWLVNKEKIRKNPVIAPDKRLCENCNRLDFTVLFRTVLNETTIKWAGKDVNLTHGIKLGSLDQIKSKKKCSFCLLVWKTISSNSEAHMHLSGPLPVDGGDLWLDNFAISNDGKISLRKHLERRGPAIVQAEISIRERQSFTGSRRSAFQIQVKPQSQLADAKSTKFWHLLKWLDSCEESHGKTSLIRGEESHVDIHERLQLFSRVIDVYRRRIVKAPKGCRYIALSYVWGGRNFSLLTSKVEKHFEQDGSIELEQFPSTIRDAIMLCRELGERYLWVDSMCITQDTEDKHNQIKGMEAIYRGATLTLVAAAGSHADVGLPGFSAEPFRLRQNSATVQGLILVNVSPDFETSVDLSNWNTRAWTYQERLLSRRLIIFTKDQIYFQCDHGRAQGDSGLDPHDSKYLEYLDSGDAKDSETYRLEMKRKVNFSIYAQMVKEYSSRKLSYISDIENAFGGINKIIHLLFGGSEVLFGIPISGLALGLLWSSRGALTRRPSSISTVKTADIVKEDKGGSMPPDEQIALRDRLLSPDMTRSNDSPTSRDSNIFPSWSWIGWIGPVEFAEIKNLAERTVSKVSWLDPLNKLKELPEECFAPPTADWSGRERWMRQVLPGEHIYYTQKRGDRHHWFCHPMEPFFHDPIPIDRDTGSLNLCGNVAERTLAVVVPKKRSKDKRYLSVLDSKGVKAGQIILDESSSDYETPIPSILLRISQTTLKEGRDDPAWGTAIAKYSGKPGTLTSNSIIDTSGAEELFDVKVYDPKICWCLYNVLMVKANSDGKLRRIGIGKVHIRAFDKVAKENQVIKIW